MRRLNLKLDHSLLRLLLSSELGTRVLLKTIYVTIASFFLVSITKIKRVGSEIDHLVVWIEEQGISIPRSVGRLSLWSFDHPLLCHFV